MKTVINTATSLPKTSLPDSEKMTGFDLDKIAIEMAGKGEQGFSIADIKKRLRVLDAIEGKNVLETVDLEDADFSTLLQCWSQMKWGLISKDIVMRDEYLKNIQPNVSTDVKE